MNDDNYFYASPHVKPFDVQVGLIPATVILFLTIGYYSVYGLSAYGVEVRNHIVNTIVQAAPSSLLAWLGRNYAITLKSSQAADWNQSLDSNAIRGEFKGNIVRRLLGYKGHNAPAASTAGTSGMASSKAVATTRTPQGYSPPGLGNWDNSCYQNSVLQGLISLKALESYINADHLTPASSKATSSTREALKLLMTSMKDRSNAGKTLWTPAKLKSMSSWQQQDAQEYFVKLLDDLEKDMALLSTPDVSGKGLASLNLRQGPQQPASGYAFELNPLNGLFAQRVGCQTCGYTEGLSLVPFNCLFIPLQNERQCNLDACLRDLTGLEVLEGVECNSCTILRTETQLERLKDSLEAIPQASAQKCQNSRNSPDECLTASVIDRLAATRYARANDDFSDSSLKACQILPKHRVTTLKSRQIVVARPPRCLAIHVNRSLFDEQTGQLRKNHAALLFPEHLNLGEWCLGTRTSGKSAARLDTDDREHWNLDPRSSLLPVAASSSPPSYELRAVLTHYGRHDNGHYVCYRRTPFETPVNDEPGKFLRPWFRISDDQTHEVDREEVLAQGGAFMLLYERCDGKDIVPVLNPPDMIATEKCRL